jgi:hypothetical protein
VQAATEADARREEAEGSSTCAICFDKAANTVRGPCVAPHSRAVLCRRVPKPQLQFASTKSSPMVIVSRAGASGPCSSAGAPALAFGALARYGAEIRGHQHHDEFHGTPDESRVISYLKLSAH